MTDRPSCSRDNLLRITLMHAVSPSTIFIYFEVIFMAPTSALQLDHDYSAVIHTNYAALNSVDDQKLDKLNDNVLKTFS